MITVNLGNVNVGLIGGPYKDIGSNYQQGNGIKLFACDDDSCVYFADYWAVGINKFDVYVVDASGAYTWYSTGINPAQTYINTIVPFGNGLFLVTTKNNYTFFVRVGNHKLNNASPILLKTFANPITNPCYAANPKIYFDAVSNLLACGFYQPAGQIGTNIYATIYKTANGVLNMLSSGFVCNAPPDTFSPAPNAAAGVLEFDGICSNGVSLASYTYQNKWSLARNVFAVSPGIESNCNVPSGASVSSLQNNVIGFSASVGTPAYLGDSNIPNFAGLNTEQPSCYYTDGNITFEFAPVNSVVTGFSTQNACLTKKYLFLCGNAEVNAETFHGAIYVANNPGIVSGNGGMPKPISILVNSARPISLSGAYKS